MRVKYVFKQVVTAQGRRALKGKDMNDLKVFSPGEIVVEGEKIVRAGEKSDFPADEEVNFTPWIAIPGLVDAHNHLVFAGYREDEFELKLKGVSYQEIARRGGGIKRTLSSTREASFEQLLKIVEERAFLFLSNGTTLCEAKSGYGLDRDTEIKQLRVAKKLNETSPLDVVPVFLGAHEVPPEKKKEDYIRELVEEIMPAVKEEGLSDYFDIFCEEGVFSVEDMKFLFEKARQFGFKLRAHAEEFSRLGSIPVAVEMGAVSVDHILNINEDDIELLAKSETVAVLMPSVSFFLKLNKYAPARQLIDKGAAVALGTDFNPGSSPVENMFFVLWLAVFKLNMSMEEALIAATLNSAYVLGKASQYGSLEEGKFADFLVLELEDYRHIFYRPGTNHLLKVFKKGKQLIDYSCLKGRG